MAKLKYGFELKNVEENSQTTNMSEKVLQDSIHNVLAESHRESERHVQTVMMSERTVISQTPNSDGVSTSSPVYDALESYLEENNTRVIGGIDIKKTVEACLAVMEHNEPRANAISLNSQGKYESNKFYNIKFHIKKFVGAIINLGLTIAATLSGDIPVAILTGVASVLSIDDAKTIELNDACGKVLQTLYMESGALGIKKGDLIGKVEKEGFTKKEIREAIDQLLKYRCIVENNGELFLREEMTI